MNLSTLKTKLGAFQFYLFLALLIGGALYIGFHWGNASYTAQQELIATSEQSTQNLKSENERLTKNLNILGVELEVARLAQQQHFTEIKQTIEQEEKLRTQLAFYQQVMAPELNEEGFLIQSFNVKAALSENTYRFELVLMQQNKAKSTLKGNLQVILIGSEEGQTKQYPIELLLSESKPNQLTFGFKYFQVIEGEIKLPNGFQPEQVSVHAEIFQFKRKKGDLTTVFDWSISTSE